MSSGDDVIDASGFTGTLAINGGDGDDIVRTSFAALSNLTYTGGGGVDTLRLLDAEARSFTSLAGNFEVLALNAGNNFVILANDASLSAIYGGTGFDTISMLDNTTGINFVMDAAKLGSTDGFASLNGGSGDDTLMVHNVTGPFADTKFARVGSATFADDIGAIENFVTATHTSGISEVGERGYEFGEWAYVCGIRNVYAHSDDTLDAGSFQDPFYLGAATPYDSALNFIFEKAGDLGNASIVGTQADDQNGTAGNRLYDTLTLTTIDQTVTDADFDDIDDMEALILSGGTNSITLESNANTTGLRVVIGGSGADIFDTSDATYTQAASLVGGAGNDSIVAGSGADTITGSNSTALGANEKDTLTGGTGSDLFILGDAANTYYNTGGRATDYAVITSFAAGDKIQLKDISSLYTPEAPAANTYGYLADVTDIFGVGALGVGVNSYIYADTDRTGTISTGDNLIAAINTTRGAGAGGALAQADLLSSTLFSIV
jgi:hypothetical protein